jgi:hypothetical protein
MNKVIGLSIASGLFLSSFFDIKSVDNQQIRAISADTVRKDTIVKDSFTKPLLKIGLDTTITKKDSLATPRIGLQRDSTYRPDTIARQKDSVLIQSQIRVANLSYMTVCPNVKIKIPITVSGPFNANNVFVVQSVEADGQFKAISDSVTLSQNITLQIPAKVGSKLRLRVVSSSPVAMSNVTEINVLPLPQAKIELTDGGISTKIGPGQEASLKVSLSGAGPWSFVLSDSTAVANTFVNPYLTSIAPTKTQSIKVLGVSNACGSGTTSGEAIVEVSQDTLPQLALTAVPKGGFKICTNTPFQVNFNATGKYEVGNGFIVQLADSATQNFINISTLGQSPIVAKLPQGLPSGKYKLRVASTFPYQSSDTASVLVATSTTTILQKDSLGIAEGGSTNLTLSFEGTSPWFVLLSDGTYQNDIYRSPYQLKVSPYNSATYSITSAGGFCGVGDFKGSAFVNVKVPPTTITTGNLTAKTICYGTEIDVPFSTTGRFFGANKFVVQVLDTSGVWVSLPTSGSVGTLKAKISPPFLIDTISIQKIRVISTAPNAEGSETSLKVIKANAALATISGNGFIRPGGGTRLKITFQNSLPPCSFTLSDGTIVNGTFINPYQMTVSPKASTEYKITMATNTCGLAAGRGVGTVKVETN